MTRKHPQSKIDKALSNLSEEDRKEFHKLLRFNTNYPKLIKWFEDKGIDNISEMNLSDYYRRTQPMGREALIINEIAAQFEGVDDTKLLDMAAALSAKACDLLMGNIDDYLETASTEAKLQALTSLLKESRQAAKDKNEQKFITDRKALIMQGVFLCFDELERIFKPTPFFNSISNAKEAILTKINQTL